MKSFLSFSIMKKIITNFFNSLYCFQGLSMSQHVPILNFILFDHQLIFHCAPMPHLVYKHLASSHLSDYFE